VKYQVKFKRQAIKDLRSLSPNIKERILAKIMGMEDELQGDIKKLTNFTPEYRLRVGTFRVLFKIDGEILRIYRVKHRRDAYQE
jgi:mRNA interferase RelE/StbE